jgi:hypothetical protein
MATDWANWRISSEESARNCAAPAKPLSGAATRRNREAAVFEKVKQWLLRLLRVPPEPAAPFGAPSSLRVFRASRRLYWLRLIGWGTAQAFALAGIIFWFAVILASEHEANRAHAEAVRRGRRASLAQPAQRDRPLSRGLKDAAGKVPPIAFVVLWIAKSIGLFVYVGQLAITYFTVRLDYEMRWYMVTDRSLRIRSGVWRVSELTMSFANVQHVILYQGPLQRLLGIADLRVQSAGGGSGAGGEGQSGQGNQMHMGVFKGVENAGEIRDLVLERLRHFRETGLGDPDEVPHASARPGLHTENVLAAARE